MKHITDTMRMDLLEALHADTRNGHTRFLTLLTTARGATPDVLTLRAVLDAELRAAPATPEAPEPWVVWSHQQGAWWGPDYRGYTRALEHAGKYSCDEARRICEDANWAPDVENEVAVPFGTALVQGAPTSTPGKRITT